MSDLKLNPSLLSMLERIEQNSGTLLMLSVTASGGQDVKLNKLRGAVYDVNAITRASPKEYGPLRLSRSPRLVGLRWRNAVQKSPKRKGGIVQATKG